MLRALRRAAASRMAARRERIVLGSCGSVGPGCRLHGSVTIMGAKNANLGSNVHIGRNAYIRAAGGLTVGDNTVISRNLVLYTTNHNHRGDRLPFDDVQVSRPVTIGRNVWIGMNVCITPGTVIEDGAIIGLGTVVHGTVPAGAIIGAAPWAVIGHRDEEHYDRLESARAYGDTNGKPVSY